MRILTKKSGFDTNIQLTDFSTSCLGKGRKKRVQKKHRLQPVLSLINLMIICLVFQQERLDRQ